MPPIISLLCVMNLCFLTGNFQLNPRNLKKYDMQSKVAAVDAREADSEIAFLARTDLNHTHGLKEANERVRQFYENGAELIIIESPKNEAEICHIFGELPK